MMDPWAIVARIADFAGFLGLGYGLYESRKATKEYARAQQLVERYERLVTEYKGKILDFERLLQETATLIDFESKGIAIALDTLAYGAVTKPDAHRKFRGSLTQKSIQGVPIRIVTFDRKAHERMLRNQCSRNTRFADADIKYALDVHESFAASLRRENASVIATAYFPLHLFVFEAQRIAIFAFHQFHDGEAICYAVKTSDPELFTICRQTFEDLDALGREAAVE